MYLAVGFSFSSRKGSAKTATNAETAMRRNRRRRNEKLRKLCGRILEVSNVKTNEKKKDKTKPIALHFFSSTAAAAKVERTANSNLLKSSFCSFGIFAISIGQTTADIAENSNTFKHYTSYLPIFRHHFLFLLLLLFFLFPFLPLLPLLPLLLFLLFLPFLCFLSFPFLSPPSPPSPLPPLPPFPFLFLSAFSSSLPALRFVVGLAQCFLKGKGKTKKSRPKGKAGGVSPVCGAPVNKGKRKIRRDAKMIKQTEKKKKTNDEKQTQ
eukprot:GHVT01029032.1.p1 GENE.GHVT01029032.1~~GHVT01029032.1.p1  ORF type:complete len:266 (-),score=55.10 GHVT01029032.1:102-899(-)